MSYDKDKSLLEAILAGDGRYHRPLSVGRNNSDVLRCQEPVGYEFLRPSNIQRMKAKLMSQVVGPLLFDFMDEVRKSYFTMASSKSMYVDPNEASAVRHLVTVISDKTVAHALQRQVALYNLHQRRNPIAMERDQQINLNSLPTGGQQYNRSRLAIPRSDRGTL
jgi:hypothetical protein